MTASYDEVLSYSRQDNPKDKVLVDSRSSERYKGIVEPIDIKKGHIRNAKNVFFRSHFNEKNQIEKDALEKNFKDIADYEDVIFHCGSGVTACTNIMAFEELGKKSRLYIGSFSDFVSYEENTVERE
jgi:thiosulfate/3-mercaptopyruvate sulfurtransferase